MKKLLIIFSAICALFSSCSKDDDKPIKLADFIGGTTWETSEALTEEGPDYKVVLSIEFKKGSDIFTSTFKKYNGDALVDSGAVEGKYVVTDNKVIATTEDIPLELNYVGEALVAIVPEFDKDGIEIGTRTVRFKRK